MRESCPMDPARHPGARRGWGGSRRGAPAISGSLDREGILGASDDPVLQGLDDFELVVVRPHNIRRSANQAEDPTEVGGSAAQEGAEALTPDSLYHAAVADSRPRIQGPRSKPVLKLGISLIFWQPDVRGGTFMTSEHLPEKTSDSLGLTPLPSGTFEHDVSVGEGYQAFSAELLRLALAGLAVVGFLVTKVLLGSPPQRPALTPGVVEALKAQLYWAIVLLAASAGLALLHRYSSTDALARHLYLLRRERVGRRMKSSATRNLWLKLSGYLLVASSATLWFGALFLALAFFNVLGCKP